LGIAWIAGAGGCSFLVDTGGLAGGPDSALDAGDAPSDAPPADGALDAADAAPIVRCDPCPAPVVLATSNTPSYIALDATTVYFADADDGTINAVPKSGGALAVLATGRTNPWVVRTNRTYVFWTENTLNRAVGRVEIASKTVLDLSPVEPMPRGIGIDDTNVYWSNEKPSDAGPASIVRAALDGTSRTVLETASAPKDVFVDADYVFWTDNGAGVVRRRPKSGGASTIIATDLSPWGLAVRGDVVAYTNYDHGTVVVMRRDGTAKVTLTSTAKTPRSVTLDDAYVYWTNEDGTTVDRAPIAGGKVVSVLTGLVSPFSVAIDDAFVYASEVGPSGASGRGRIVKGPL
jgi:hypothetical protein